MMHSYQIRYKGNEDNLVTFARESQSLASWFERTLPPLPLVCVHDTCAGPDVCHAVPETAAPRRVSRVADIGWAFEPTNA